MERLAVIGSGTMGLGIAQLTAMAEYDTILYDVDQAALDRDFRYQGRFHY